MEGCYNTNHDEFLGEAGLRCREMIQYNTIDEIKLMRSIVSSEIHDFLQMPHENNQL